MSGTGHSGTTDSLDENSNWCSTPINPVISDEQFVKLTVDLEKAVDKWNSAGVQPMAEPTGINFKIISVKSNPKCLLSDKWKLKIVDTPTFYAIPGYSGYYPIPKWRTKPRTRREKKDLRRFEKAIKRLGLN